MKNIKPYFLLSGIFISFCLSSCLFNNSKSKQKINSNNQINFTNKSNVPLIAICKNENTVACFQNSISDLILNEAKRRNLTLKNDTLKVGVRINKDGTTSILDNETTNSELNAVTEDVLLSMEIIEPAFIDSQNSYQTVSYSWFIVIKDNKMINRFH